MAPPPQEEAANDGIPEAGFEEEEDPEEVEPWIPSSDSEPEPDRPALDPPEPDPSPAAAGPEMRAAEMEGAERKGDAEEARQRWPGWPGASVFRLVVPAAEVGGVIGRRGSTIKRLCDETRARVRVLDAPQGAANRIVLVSATEEVEAELSPAMNAAIKIFKHINGIEEINSYRTLSASAPEMCYVRLLVPAARAVHLIGKQGVTIKSIQESSGATIRIIDEDELLTREALDERIVEMHGASLTVHNALKSVLGLLRKFLVDHGVLHLFERKDQLGHACDPSFHVPYSTELSHPSDPLTTQVTQTMKIPLPYAEEIIGVRGENIEFIRSVSGAVVVLEEIRDYPDEVLVTIKGGSSQVETAHQLLQEVLSGDREPPPPTRPRSCYRDAEAGSWHTAADELPSHAIATSRDYLPWQHYEDDEPPPRDSRRYPAHYHDHRGYYWP